MATSTTSSKPHSLTGPKSRLPAGARRALIVDAALEEFAERGYEAASVGRIAAAAGISRTVLYDHFPSKHALFVELLSSQHAALLGFIGEPIGMDIPMRERMQLTFDAFFLFAEERPLAWRLLFPDNPPLDEHVADEHRRRRAEANRLRAKMIEPIVQGAARWWRAHPDVPRAEVVRAVMATLWTGMSAVERGEPWVAEE